MFNVNTRAPFSFLIKGFLLIPILFLSIIQNTWIPHEEEKLKEKFPEDWEEYTTSTKRWLW